MASFGGFLNGRHRGEQLTVLGDKPLAASALGSAYGHATVWRFRKEGSGRRVASDRRPRRKPLTRCPGGCALDP